jgi:hypothetical protein
MQTVLSLKRKKNEQLKGAATRWDCIYVSQQKFTSLANEAGILYFIIVL